MGLREEIIKDLQMENLLKEWAEPPSDTEDQRCDNAVSVVQNAIKSFPALKNREIKIFAQGSYRNGTNIKTESDVDICVCCMDPFFINLPEGFTKGDIGLSDSDYEYSEFKNDVHEALKVYLGARAITRGNKAFDLHENSYRLNADVVPTFEHRRYAENLEYISGTELWSDDGSRIINWPNQNYKNGTEKNLSTKQRFKKVVRILKRLKNFMEEQGVQAAKPIPSYLVECLVWNVLNDQFGNDNITDDVKNVLLYLFGLTKEDAPCSKWGEVNQLKYLFRSAQPWTRTQVNDFVIAAWTALGFQ